jgi:predicted enzyme related to lactoylglutathione lyase
MSTPNAPRVGEIMWHDLTVPNADEVRAFYEAVAGWRSEAVAMDGYDDHCMLPRLGNAPVAGVCHALGTNANLPPQWLMYVVVDDLEERSARAVELGGAVVDGPREVGGGTMAVVRDPAGAVVALWQAGA